MNIYIAGKYEARGRLRGERARLRAMDHEVISSWLDETAHRDECDRAYLQRAAWRDLRELERATLVFADTLDESTTGGREVEVGYALALGKPVWLIGPQRNVFHYLIRRPFVTWDAALASLEAICAEP